MPGKSLLIAVLIGIFCQELYSQDWKQYADSAQYYNEAGKVDKAIAFYTKAKTALPPDSLVSLSRALVCDSLGKIYMRAKDYSPAEIELVESLAIKNKLLGREHPDYLSGCNSLGRLYGGMGNFNKALPFFVEVKQTREKLLGKLHPDYIDASDILGTVYAILGRYDQALPLLLEVKAFKEKSGGKMNQQYLTASGMLASAYWMLRQYQKAEALIIENRDISGKLLGKDHSEYINNCRGLAVLYNDMGQYEKALPYYIETKNLLEKNIGKNNPDYAEACNNLGAVYLALEQFLNAEALFIESKNIREKVLGKAHPDYANSCNNLGALYRDMGQFSRAEALYKEAMRLCESTIGKDNEAYLTNCNNLAILYAGMSEYEKAEALFLTTKQIRERLSGKESPEYSVSCNNLSNFYRELGQYVKAESLGLEAKQVIEKMMGRENVQYASTCVSLGAVYAVMKQYERAEPLFLEAKQIRERLLGKEHSAYAASCDNLGNIYSYTGQLEKAESFYREALLINEKVLGKESPGYAVNCTNLAVLFWKLGRYEQSGPLLLQASKIFEKKYGSESLQYIQSLNNLGNLYWTLQQPEKANEFYSRSFRKTHESARKIFRFSSEKEKWLYLKEVGGMNDGYFSFYSSAYPASSQGFAYNVSLITREMILASSRQMRRFLYAVSDTVSKNTYNHWIDIKEQLAFFYSNSPSRFAGEITRLEEEANSLEKDLSRISGFNEQANQQEPDWHMIQEKLKPGEAAVEFAEFSYYNGTRQTDSTLYIALVVRKDRPEPQVIRLFEKKDLDSLLKTGAKNDFQHISQLYRNSKGIPGMPSAGNRLYKLIWDPLDTFLTGINKIFYAPAGLLHRISFAALQGNEQQLLSDKYHLVQVSTTSSVNNTKPDIITTRDKIMLYGGVLYNVDTARLKTAVSKYNYKPDNASRSLPDDLERNNNWQELPGTLAEIRAIENLARKKKINVMVRTGADANEESVKALNGANSPHILHIATHGFFFADPAPPKKESGIRERSGGVVLKESDNPLMRSGLLLAGANRSWLSGKSTTGIEDGIFTAYEVSNLYLPNTRLAVLSACETALGDLKGSEGVYGLQRAFKMAGVENLLMSLWKVPDEETAEFMQLFYGNLFKKQTFTDAFYQAQTSMKNKYWNDPYRWAAFVLVQ